MSAPSPAGAAPPAGTQRVWSRAVRLGHWGLAASVLLALLLHEGGAWHERLGYAALALVAWRLLHGLRPGDATHQRFTRFAAFVRGPRATWHYLRQLRAGHEPHTLGHNPLGAWMVLALLAAAGVAAASGALYDTDRFWGDPVVYAVHQGAGWSLAVLAPMHVAGVIFTSLRQRENLVRAMITGDKADRSSRPPAGAGPAATGREPAGVSAPPAPGAGSP